ncbi:MAG TPA: outer membrane lipoprotein-sorting protein [Gemmatimonadaceae bacterium]|nr:outer membrane lipoprotein-sorting protein [Gemmatimonadaceae bacterium]
MITRIVGVALAAAAAIAATPAQQSDARQAREIMEKNFFVTKVSALRLEATMVLITDKGQRRERRTSSAVKLQPNGVDSKLLVTFSAPADIRGTGFLQVEHSEGDDDLWIYLPALKKSRRLVANNKRDSFVGSDFAYGDISLPKVEKYNHKLLKTEEVDGTATYVVESTPATPQELSGSGYSKKITWVRADNYLEVKVEYYDLANRLFKTQRLTKHEAVDAQKGKWFPREREMVNHQTGHRTTFSVDKLESGVALSDEMFTTRYIER